MPEYDSMEEFINAIRGVEGLGGLSGRHLLVKAVLFGTCTDSICKSHQLQKMRGV